MCGIAGFSGHFDKGLLDAMNQAMAHRGPDGSGTQMLNCPTIPVGLTHRRLSIIDLSEQAAQPMSVDCPSCGCRDDHPATQRLWISYNGEIYNFAQLRHSLVQKGHRFKSRSDTEVLVHLYAEHGPQMLSKLNGIFALALYDGREGQGSLLLARDPMGVKPLYYSQTADGFVFASEIKSLLQCPAVDAAIDPVAIHYYLAYLWAPAPNTALANVRKLEPGSAMIIGQGRIQRCWRYAELPYGAAPLKASPAAMADQLRRRLETAVARQMVSDVPVGAFLSGGLDSSAVVSMMRRVAPQREPICYCIGFSGNAAIDGTVPDLPYARRVAASLGVDLRETRVGPEIITHMEQAIYHMDEPQADPSPIHVMQIARQAKADGIKVLLSGTGGDDIFSGYRRHFALGLETLWTLLPQSVRNGLARWSAPDMNAEIHRGGLARRPFFRRIQKTLAHADLSAEDRLMAYFLWSPEGIRRPLYADGLAKALDGVDTLAPLRATLERLPPGIDPLDRMLFLETTHFLADHNLNYVDKAAMAEGVEVRVPLLDPDMVAFAIRVPPSWKQRGTTGKAIFKRAMEPLLPRDVIYRPKTGFGAPIRRWLHHEMREMVEEVLSPVALKRSGLFCPQAVQRLRQMDAAGVVDGSYTLFALVTIQLWVKLFIHQKGRFCG